MCDLSKAIEATHEIARRLEAGGVHATLLHRSRHITLRLAPLNVVAQVIKLDAGRPDERLQRQIAVAQHLVRKCAAVVPPPGGSDRRCGSSWSEPAHLELAARVLYRAHAALADYPGELPCFGAKLEGCRALLEDRSALPALKDRAFLMATHHTSRARWIAGYANLFPSMATLGSTPCSSHPKEQSTTISRRLPGTA